MKKIFSWAVIMLTAMIGMTACSDDDENENVNEFPMAGNTSMPAYNILSKNTYTKDQYKNLLLKEFQKYIGNASPFVSTIVNMQLGNLMNNLPAETNITIVNFECPSAGQYGIDVKISGQIIVPTLGNKLVKDTLVLDNRFTQLKDSEVPTKSLNVGAVLAVTGCPVVTCDMLGYGSSRRSNLNYHCYHYSSRNTVDAALAGIAVLHGPELGLDISDEPLPVYNEGYSQGGYGALAVQKYLEADCNTYKDREYRATAFEKRQLPLLKTVCGAGAYDPTKMLDVILDNHIDVYPYYCYIVAALETAFKFHPEDYDYGSITLKDVFTEKVYNSSLIWMTTSRNYNTSEIMNKFFEEMGGKKNCTGNDVFSWAMFSRYEELPKRIREKGKSESLVEGWVPQSPLHFYHARNDEAVPVQCAQLARDNFGNGPNNNITYDIDTNVTKLLDLLEVDGLQPHTMGYFNFMIQTVLEDLKGKPEDK